MSHTTFEPTTPTQSYKRRKEHTPYTSSKVTDFTADKVVLELFAASALDKLIEFFFSILQRVLLAATNKNNEENVAETLQEFRIRFGVHENGLEIIEKETKFVEELQYFEVFLNKEKMLQDEWEKLVVIELKDGEQSHKKTLKQKPFSFGSSAEYLRYNTHIFTKVTSHPIDEEVAKFKVKRTVREENIPNPRWKILLDEVTFKDGDPHFVCAFVWLRDLIEVEISELNKISELLKSISVMPVRSKIIEYFYRYEPDFYKQLISKQIIKDLEYHQPTTPNQLQELYKRRDWYILLQRFYGISPEEYEKLPEAVYPFEKDSSSSASDDE